MKCQLKRANLVFLTYDVREFRVKFCMFAAVSI